MPHWGGEPSLAQDPTVGGGPRSLLPRAVCPSPKYKAGGGEISQGEEAPFLPVFLSGPSLPRTRLIPEVRTLAVQVTVTVIGPRDGHVIQGQPTRGCSGTLVGTTWKETLSAH